MLLEHRFYFCWHREKGRKEEDGKKPFITLHVLKEKAETKNKKKGKIEEGSA